MDAARQLAVEGHEAELHDIGATLQGEVDTGWVNKITLYSIVGAGIALKGVLIERLNDQQGIREFFYEDMGAS